MSELRTSKAIASSYSARGRSTSNYFAHSRYICIVTRVFSFTKIGFPTSKPPVCLDALGMQNGQVPDSAITASTEYYSATKAFNGRLHFLSSSGRVGAWVAQWNDNNPFLQVHFSDWRKVTRVAIQGRQDADQWVESFSLSYGYDSVFFEDYKEDGVKRVSIKMNESSK